MKQLSSADFRKIYARESEPVEVTAHGKPIGRWYPAGTVPEGRVAAQDAPQAVAEAVPEETAATERRMTIRPIVGQPREMVGSAKRVIDPVEAARIERQRYSQLASRMYGRKERSTP